MKRGLLAIALGVFASSAYGAPLNNTLFLHHFDGPIGSGADTADYANGDPTEQVPTPFGHGGQIVSSPAKFGAGALYRTDGSTIGGRVEYKTAGNYDPNLGTIEMWINSATLTTSTGFDGLWGTVTGSGNTDARMYIYSVGGVRTLGAYQQNGGGAFWEEEQAIPAALLTDNEWHHVAWAFDTANGKAATWWDGHLLRNTPDAGTISPRTTFNNTLFHIGENQNGSAAFPGYIDEFRISDKVQYDTTNSFTPPTAPFAVPEPASLALLATAGLLMGRRRRKA